MDVCIWPMFVFMSVLVRVCGNVCETYVVFYVCIVRRRAVGARIWEV